MDHITVWKLAKTADFPYTLVKVHLVPEPTSLNQASQEIPGGVYTTLRTFDGDKILPLDDHVRRLETSAQLVNQTIHLDPVPLRGALRQAIQRFGAGEARVRITLDLEQQPGHLYLALEPLELPSLQDYQKGVLAVTVRFERQNPQAKRTSFIPVTDAFHRQLPPGANEGLLVDGQGCILEGLSSNFFAVKDGVLWTEGEKVLAGITRALILEAARKENIPVQMECISISELTKLQESFISSSSRAVLPVRQIDRQVIGSGKPGPLTQKLSQAYWREVRSRLEKM